jgi:O-antigen/teichoic acid export membrane protein
MINISTARRVTSNSILSMATDIVAKAVRALTFIMVARHLGPDASGAFTVALSYQAIFQAFTLTGTDYLLVREVAKNRETAADYFLHMAAMKIALSCISWVALVLLLLKVFHYPSSTSLAILLLALSILPEGLGEVCRAVFVAFERMLYPAVAAGVIGVARLAVSYLLLCQGAGIEALILVVVASSGIGAVVNLVFIFAKLIKPVWNLRWNFFRTSLPNLAAFASMGILRVLEYHVTVLLLSYIGDDRQVGIYNAAYTLVLGALMVSQAYASGAMPVLSRLYARSHVSQLALFYRKSVQLMWVAALPLAVLVAQFSPTFILSVYTFEYTGAIPVLQWLSLVVLLTLFIAPHACIMLAVNLQRWVVGILLISIVINVLAGIVLIPRYGAVGASVARVIATAGNAVLYCAIVYARVVRVSIFRLIGFVTMAGGVMIGMGWILRDANPWLALLLSGVAYLAVLALLVVFSEEDRHLALQILGRSSK